MKLFTKHNPPTITSVKTPLSAPREVPPDWYSNDYEGALSVDVYETLDSVIIISTLAGVRPEDLEITLNNDVITIRGSRSSGVQIPAEEYLYRECYWGAFSRSIVLPTEVKADKVQADLKNGVLTITLPKVITQQAVSVTVKTSEI